VTALTQEIRIQGRTFKQLNETLLNETLPKINLSLEASAAASSSRSAEDAPLDRGSTGTRQPRRQEIDILLDLRDRIERGGNTARIAAGELASARLPFFVRWLGLGRSYARHTQEVLAALSHGYSLTLDCLDEALVSCRVSRIAAEGRIFDPQRMTAVDIEETESVPEGTVVEVYRNGFEWNNEVYRTAQVKVARAAK
jgi:molecular chaperone GrpE